MKHVCIKKQKMKAANELTKTLLINDPNFFTYHSNLICCIRKKKYLNCISYIFMKAQIFS